MPKQFNKTLVTAALPYANGPLHIGHLAGCYLPSDVYVRFLKSNNKDVLFICGSDEHGVPITIKAKKENITPQQVVDKYHKLMKSTFIQFGIQFDNYSRTSSKIHHNTAQDFFKTLLKKNVFTIQDSDQYYDETAQQFLADRYITGTCPKCANDKAYGDQCEKCGTSLNALDLINPISTLSGNKPSLKKTTNWYLPLDKLQPKIAEYINQHSDWKGNVYGQCKSWLENNEGLQPRAMTRDLDWGVKVPIENTPGKVMYVWFDAPIGYISATKEILPDTWQSYWQNSQTKLIHFIGKDNIVFHCIIFPAMLMEHENYILPEFVPANEFLNLEGEKISTSKNWAIWLHEYLIDFPNMQDVLRYTLCTIAPENKDSDFTWKDFQSKNNNELVAILGNFVNRTVVLIHKYYEGKVPKTNDFQAIDTQTIQSVKETILQIENNILNYKFKDANAEMMNIARIGNKYLAETEPWKLIKTDPERVKSIMNIAIQITCTLAIISEPFLPFTSAKLFSMLKITPLKWAFASGVNNISENHQINDASLLFTKIEDETMDQQIEKLKR